MLRVAPDTELEAATWGPPPDKAATIVLLHEGLGCVDLWRDFPQVLSERTGCGVLAYSRLGYGRSSPIEPPLPVTRMSDEAANVLPLVLERIAPKRLILVGHSDGGTIAAHYLAGRTHPALRGAALLAAHFFNEASNVAAIRDTYRAYEETDLKQRLAKYHGSNVDGAFRGWAATWLNPAFADWDMRAEMRHWCHPVLFIQGRDDPYGSTGQANAAEGAPGTEVRWLDECGHNPHIQQRTLTLDALQTFIGRLLDDESFEQGNPDD